MAGFWKKALVYLGLFEEEDELEPLPEISGEQPQLETVRPLRPDTSASGIRPVASAQPQASVQPAAAAPAVQQPFNAEPAYGALSPSVQPAPAPAARLFVVEPKSFEDAKEVGDRVRAHSPVILNLQEVDKDLGTRMLDFASGLTYGIGGGIKPVAKRVYLITPANVEVSAEETQRIISQHGFFNQF